jgi:hypothetical protein
MTDPATAQQERRARYVTKALMEVSNPATRAAIADECIAVADAEQADLKAEVTHAWRHVSEAEGERDEARAEVGNLTHDLAVARGSFARLAAEWEKYRAESQEFVARADITAANLNAARATIAHVKELADEWAIVPNDGGTHWTGCHLVHADCFVLAIRALLAGRPVGCGDRECDECNPAAWELSFLRAKSHLQNGFGLWLASPGYYWVSVAHDPPAQRTITDPDDGGERMCARTYKEHHPAHAWTRADGWAFWCNGVHIPGLSPPTWLSTPMDDALPAIKARLEAAMRRQGAYE